MPINIHGNEYVTVAERIGALHEKYSDKEISITTEFIPSNSLVICKAKVRIGANTFDGTSAANPAKAIEKQSPYEVAETSAIGRALGFAGLGIVEGIATADEIAKGGYDTPKEELTATCAIHRVTMRHFTKEDREWWSHKLDDGTWCNGKPPKKVIQPKQEEYDYGQVTDDIPF